jgi:N-acetylneuraminic acid mutarotase
MFAAGNAPGGRSSAVSWTDGNGNLWLFGGLGVDSAGKEGYLNDLWEFNPFTGEWAWMGGGSALPASTFGTPSQPGVFGNLGVAAAGNFPPGREGAVTWTDSSGNFWLFGGFGSDSTGQVGLLNDLWEFDLSTGLWAWMSGSSTIPNDPEGGVTGQLGVYGTLGLPAAGNIPGGRNSAVSWTDGAGNLWLFGGYAYTNSGSAVGMFAVNDLWKYQPPAGTSRAARPTFNLIPGIYASPQTITISDATTGATIYYTTDGTLPTTASTVYSAPLAVSSNITIRAMAAASEYANSAVAAVTYTINPLAAPSFSVASGSYPSAQTVAISDATPGATIYYTTDGSKPTMASAIYSTPLTVASSATIEAMAVAGGYSESAVAAAIYAILPTVAAPTFSVASGSYTSVQIVTISDATPGAKIYYTTDGSTPTTASSAYSSPLSIIATQTITAFAVASGYYPGPVASAAYTIKLAVLPTGQWAWMSGNDLPGYNPATGMYTEPGVYGSLAVPAAGNIPGGRMLAAGWTDRSGNFWLFGGYGDDSTGIVGDLNDLWMFNPVTNQWVWMGGNSTVPATQYGNGGQPGVYGNLGTPAPGNIPGGRSGAVSWTDTNGNVWLFGGYGYDSAGNTGYLNDLWMFIPASNQWAWMGGSSTVPATQYGNGGQPGVYGNLGTPAPGNTPGGRSGAVSWTGSNGNVWLFGGYGYDSADYGGYLDDLWSFSPSTGQWTWIGGYSGYAGYPCGLCGVMGTLGIPAAGNIPGARANAIGQMDGNGNLWLFGGYGYASQATYDGMDEDSMGDLNDLWKFTPSTGLWTWMGGNPAMPETGYQGNGTPGDYGFLTTPMPANFPGSRLYAVSWADGNGNLWLFGGSGFDGNWTNGSLNDLWQFNFALDQWTWMSGSSTYPINDFGYGEGQPSVYGLLGIAASTNTPGSRLGATSWTDRSGNLWLFGGQGNDSAWSQTYLNDFWKYQLPGTAASSAAIPTFDVAPGIYMSAQTVTISDATPGATIYYTTDGSIPTAASAVYTAPLTVTSTETIMAIAAASGLYNSAVGGGIYTLWNPAATPIFSVASGSYPSTQTVALSDATPGAIIYYTTDGTTPTTASTVYSTPITVTSSETITAMAVAGGYSNSDWAFANYTIGATANPAGATTGEWVWMGGSNSNGGCQYCGQPGIYGMPGIPSTGSFPGARYGAATWTDHDGNVWLFGGYGFDSRETWDLLNDLWFFNPASRQWAWMGGSSTVPTDEWGDGLAQPGIYGTMGTPAAGNLPGGRSQANTWIDSTGNLWLLGGYGYDAAGTLENLNDLWVFTPSTGQWTWMSGSSTVPCSNSGCSVQGVYGTSGVPAAGNVPGSLGGAVTWTDSNNNLWLFSGSDLANDLWEFSPSSEQWTWFGGGGDQTGVYGTLGTPAPTNLPGGRMTAASWTDHSGNVWLFGGWGMASTAAEELSYYSTENLNDLWEFNPSTSQWAWMGGTSNLRQPGVYSQLDIYAATNVPGARSQAASWKDGNGQFWMFGGDGFDSTGLEGSLNDLWQLNPSTLQWAWMGGSSTVPSYYGSGTGQPGVYGTIGIPSAGNVPGGRFAAASWTDRSGNLWLFGGQGYDSAGQLGTLNDLWEYRLPATTATTAIPTFDVTPGTYTSIQSVTLSDTTAGAAIYYTTDGSTPLPAASPVAPTYLYTGPITVATSETISAIATASNESNSAMATAAYTITLPLAPLLTLTCTEAVYDGESHSCTASATGAGGAAVSGSWTIAPASESEAGSYAVTGTFTSNDPGYLSNGTATGTLVIDPANQNPAITCPGPLSYDGQAHSCSVSGGFGTCSSGSVTDVPGGSVALSCLGDADHNPWTGSGSIPIMAATSTVVTPPPVCTFPYDGQPHSCPLPNPVGIDGQPVNGSWSCISQVPPVNVGTYTETCSFNFLNINYVINNQNVKVTVIITKGTATISCSTTPVQFTLPTVPVIAPCTVVIGKNSIDGAPVTYTGVTGASINHPHRTSLTVATPLKSTAVIVITAATAPSTSNYTVTPITAATTPVVSIPVLQIPVTINCTYTPQVSYSSTTPAAISALPATATYGDSGTFSCGTIPATGPGTMTYKLALATPGTATLKSTLAGTAVRTLTFKGIENLSLTVSVASTRGYAAASWPLAGINGNANVAAMPLAIQVNSPTWTYGKGAGASPLTFSVDTANGGNLVFGHKLPTAAASHFTVTDANGKPVTLANSSPVGKYNVTPDFTLYGYAIHPESGWLTIAPDATKLTWNHTSLNLSAKVGGSSSATITMTNRTGETLNIGAGLDLVGPVYTYDPFSLCNGSVVAGKCTTLTSASSSCSNVAGNGGTCKITVVFTPTTSGTVNRTLTLETDPKLGTLLYAGSIDLKGSATN